MAVAISKRSVVNLNFPSAQEYDVINCWRMLNNFPATIDFSGPYVVKWSGARTLQFLAPELTFTVDDGQSTAYTKPSSTQITATDARVVFSFNSGQALTSQANIALSGGSTTSKAIYRLADEADFLAGKYFRRAYLTRMANLNPSAVRPMNWFGGTDSYMMRWEHRSLLTDLNWEDFCTSGGIATYGTTSGANIMTLAGLPTLYHGLPVQCTIGAGMVRGGANTVTNVTRANPGVVTYSGTDNYQNGDKVVFRVTAGMTQLDFRICTVANVNTGANTFELSGLDTSGFTAWSSGSVMQYISLNGYPVVFNTGSDPASQYSSGYIQTNDIKTFYFDSPLVAAKDETTGVSIQGAWVFNNFGTPNFHRTGVVPALLVAYITELDAVAQSIGKGPIDLYITIPARSLLSMDPDYDVASNVAVQFVNLFLNGGDGVSAAPSRVRLFLAINNESWNSPFSGAQYYATRAKLRWGVTNDFNTFQTLRQAVMAHDIRTAFPNNLDRIIFVMEGQGTIGVSAGNVVRMDGNTTLAADSYYQSIGGGAIGTNKQFWDCFAIGSYFELSSSFISGTLPGLVTQWVNGNASQKDAAIASVVNGAVSSSGNNESIQRYKDVLLPAYNTKMASLDRVLIGYEGANQFIIQGAVNDTYNCLWAARSDQRWAAAYRTWFDAWKQYSNVGMPAEYVTIQSPGTDHRWDHISYGYNDVYANGVEGGSLDLAWDQISDYNSDPTPPTPSVSLPSGSPYLNPITTTTLRHRNFSVPAGYPHAKTSLVSPYGHRSNQRLGSTFRSGSPNAHRIGSGVKLPPRRK